MSLEQGDFLDGAGDVESAGVDDDNVGVGLHDGLPFEPGGMFSGLAEEVFSTGHFDEFGYPVSGGHEGLDPFDGGDGWPVVEGGGFVCYFVHFVLNSIDEFVAALGDSEGVGDGLEVAPDVGEAVGFEGDDADLAIGPVAYGLFYVAKADGADFALALGEDDVGFELAKGVGKDAVDGEAFLEDGFDALVDFVAGAFDGELGFGAGGKGFDGLGIVALVGPSDEHGLGAEGADGFGGAGDKGDDSRRIHGAIPRPKVS